MSLSDMEARGELEPLATSDEELARLLAAVDRRLTDAGVDLTSNEARFEHAYHAMLGAALAALRAHEYRVVGPTGKHFLTLKTLRHTIRIPDKQVRYIQKLRHRRNLDLYEGGTPVSKVELDEAMSLAREVSQLTRKYVVRLRPDLKS